MEEAPVERPLTELLEAIRAPISDSNPVGVDVTYEEAFQQLKAEIDKIGSASGEADYDRIVAQARKILSEQSKDLNAACYLAIALSRTEGWQGIAEGFAAVRHLAEGFWEDLFPLKRRMAARRNALQFVLERVGDWIELNSAQPGDREAVQWTLEEVEALQAHAMTEMGDDAPAFSLVVRLLRDQLRRLPDPTAAPAPAAAETTPGQGDGAAAAPAATPLAASAAATPAELQSADDAARLVIRSAAFLRKEEPYSVAGFRLVRVLRFGGLEALPPNEGGRTMLEGPPAQRREALEGMFDRGDHAELLEAAEEAFLETPLHFWLDLQRMIAASLGALGVKARPAQEAVTDEAAALVRRLPGIQQLTFADGMPFANPVTVAWLEEVSAAQAAAGGSGGGEADEAFEADLAEARSLAGAGKLPDAIRKLDTPGTSPRAAFGRRLAAADLCFKAGRPEVARPLLEALDERAAEHRLHAWEPDMALQLLRQLRRCYDALEAKAPEAQQGLWRERSEAVFQRLCQVDPAAALSG